jgi:phage-related protein
MYATDFLFDTNLLSDFGLMIGSFDNGVSTATGGSIEFTVVKPPNSDRFNFYGAQCNEVLEWEFSIIKMPCKTEDMYFTEIEERQLAQWLVRRDGYKLFQFHQDDYDVYYYVQINMIPHQVNGKTVGFDLTVTSNAGYGYSQELTQIFTINNKTSAEFNLYGDVNDYILPVITITNGSGSFYISNDSDLSQSKSNQKQTSFTNVKSTLIIDSENDIITGLPSTTDWNWYFPRLVNGTNVITTNSTKNLDITIKYREQRRVII